MITNISEYRFATPPSGVIIDDNVLPVRAWRDLNYGGSTAKILRGVDCAFLLEAVCERVAASGQGSFATRGFAPTVSRIPFRDIIDWLFANVGYNSIFRYRRASPTPFYDWSSSTLFPEIYGNYISNSALKSDESKQSFAYGAPLLKQPVRDLYDDIALMRTFVPTLNYHTLSTARYSTQFTGNDPTYEESFRFQYGDAGTSPTTHSALYYHHAEDNSWMIDPYQQPTRPYHTAEAVATLGNWRAERIGLASNYWGEIDTWVQIATLVRENTDTRPRQGQVVETSYHDWYPVAAVPINNAPGVYIPDASLLTDICAALRQYHGIRVKTADDGENFKQEITQSIYDFGVAVTLGIHTDWQDYLRQLSGQI